MCVMVNGDWCVIVYRLVCHDKWRLVCVMVDGGWIVSWKMEVPCVIVNRGAVCHGK